jgi:eukaryotic-like serine/threonine-protein kinase
MEYVPGKSLDALIPRQGMRLNEALRIAIAVADALVTAHARGIVHRDLKPANVIVGTDGTVKVLDFGLAKLIGHPETSDEDSPTLTSHALRSAPGSIAGTAAYMAPEQATGGTVDTRSDIFSFGAMLYEMVTGSRAFPGASRAETLNAVIRVQPTPPGTAVAGLPSDLEKVILRCLRKDPKRRYQHIDDVKVALEDIKEESESGVAPPSVARTHRRGRNAALGAAAVVVLGATAWLLLPHRRLQPPAPRRPVALTSLTGSEFYPSFSPDGEQVAFSWNGTKQDNWDVYVTLVGSSDVRRLTSDLAEDARPAWSPDGRQIAFVRQRSEDSTIYLVSPLGSGERRLGDFRGADSLDWSPDGQWLAAGNSGSLNFGWWASLLPRLVGKGPRGIYLISAERGASRPLIVSQANRVDSKPAFSPAAGASRTPPARRTTWVWQGCEIAMWLWWKSIRRAPLRGVAASLRRSIPPTSTRWLGRETAAPSSTLPWGSPFPACGVWLSMAITSPSASRRPATPPRRLSPGYAIGWRSHVCLSTATSIDPR